MKAVQGHDMERPHFLHRSRSHLHEAKSGFHQLFTSRSESPGNSELISSTKQIEEETQPRYHPDAFYPVRLGELLNDRYKVSGMASTPLPFVLSLT